MLPIANRLRRRLEDRRAFFENWLFQWFGLKDGRGVSVDLFNGKKSHWEGIGYFGSTRDVFWEALPRGIRNEILEQLEWVEREASRYRPEVLPKALDEAAGQLGTFVEIIRHRAIDCDQGLRGDGINIPGPSDQGRWYGTSKSKIRQQADAILEAHQGGSPSSAISKRDALAFASDEEAEDMTKYQVALSFAGEQREYIEAVAEYLKKEGVTVFYDRHSTVDLWGKDGAAAFTDLFSKRAAYVVMFISEDYVSKAWPRQERQAAISRQMQDEDEYILPVRFDQAEVPGLPSTLQYVQAEQFQPSDLAKAIIEKIGHSPLSGKASDAAPQYSESLRGKVAFDYTNHDGRYLIGEGEVQFETKWSGAGADTIHAYNDPPTIHGIAIAEGATRIDEITDASSYDFSSRSRRANKGEVVILRNIHGNYAALELIEIGYKGRNSDRFELRFTYRINPNGVRDFSA
ncbi:TIR domain-containing protein [Erythrobacter litoralis]|uniref:TIR domain-containing protein n=1 Tax=Erythrobacter litoralis TaxID=39960 RepID=UPI0024359B5F|nr:TIR domain-containing protein [Erythrobacter litoralis]MDG6079731.1 TIR domain-containing protein [Erythrobacter litoralis]